MYCRGRPFPDTFYVRHLLRPTPSPVGVLLFHKSCDNSCEQAQIPPTQMHSYTNLKRQEIVLGPANCHRLRFESVWGGTTATDNRRQPTLGRNVSVGWLSPGTGSYRDRVEIIFNPKHNHFLLTPRVNGPCFRVYWDFINEHFTLGERVNTIPAEMHSDRNEKRRGIVLRSCNVN